MFWWNEAVKVIEATEVIEAVEVIEAAEAPDAIAREITQYAKYKLSFSVKKRKQAKNFGKKIESIFTVCTFKLSFAYIFLHPFRTEALEDRDVISNQIQVS